MTGQEIFPTRISYAERELIQESSRKIYARLVGSGVVRIDFILNGYELFFLEINTIPGMTSASLVPKMIRTAGLSISGFLSEVIAATSAK